VWLNDHALFLRLPVTGKNVKGNNSCWQSGMSDCLISISRTLPYAPGSLLQLENKPRENNEKPHRDFPHRHQKEGAQD
jgi:hypothetical protein